MAAKGLAVQGVLASLHLRDADVSTPESRRRNLMGCQHLIEEVALYGLPEPEVSVKMEQLGYRTGGAAVAERALRDLADRADALGVLLTLNMELQYQVKDTIAVWAAVHAEHRSVGIGIHGRRVRCYVPCGPSWYSWFLRRIRERPANLLLLGKSFTARQALIASQRPPIRLPEVV